MARIYLGTPFLTKNKKAGSDCPTLIKAKSYRN